EPPTHVSGDPLPLDLETRAETRNEADPTNGIGADHVANADQLVDCGSDIEDRHRLGMDRMFDGMHPKNPLRVMPRALDRVACIKQVEKMEVLVAPGHPADLPAIAIPPVKYVAA